MNREPLRKKTRQAGLQLHSCFSNPLHPPGEEAGLSAFYRHMVQLSQQSTASASCGGLTCYVGRGPQAKASYQIISLNSS